MTCMLTKIPGRTLSTVSLDTCEGFPTTGVVANSMFVFSHCEIDATELLPRKPLLATNTVSQVCVRRTLFRSCLGEEGCKRNFQVVMTLLKR